MLVHFEPAPSTSTEPTVPKLAAIVLKLLETVPPRLDDHPPGRRIPDRQWSARDGGARRNPIAIKGETRDRRGTVVDLGRAGRRDPQVVDFNEPAAGDLQRPNALV